MQTNLLSAQREEKQPLSAQDMSQSEGSSLFEITQPKLTPVDGGIVLKTPLRAEKKRAKLNIAAIGLAFLVFLLLLSFAWVGYWTFKLSTELAATQQQLTTLQAEHAKLQTDYATLTSENEKLNADLTQSKADLEKTTSDLTSARADLSESKQRGEKLDSRIETAGTLAEILYITATSDEESDILKIARLIHESNNQKLMEQWDMLTQSPSENAFGAFLDYIVSAIRDSLK
jgi:septal ring factor EnvC (AmiA/AmiB activator)